MQSEKETSEWSSYFRNAILVYWCIDSRYIRFFRIISKFIVFYSFPGKSLSIHFIDLCDRQKCIRIGSTYHFFQSEKLMTWYHTHHPLLVLTGASGLNLEQCDSCFNFTKNFFLYFSVFFRNNHDLHGCFAVRNHFIHDNCC